MGFNREKLVNGLKMLAADFRALGNKEEWEMLPARVEEVNAANKANNAKLKTERMEKQKLTRRDFLKISTLGSTAAALIACGGAVGEQIVNVVTSTPPKDKKLGIQTDKVQILDKEGLAKDNPFQAQRVSVAENQFGIAVAEALKAKGISDAKIVTEQFTITFPVLGLDGKETNPVYSFVGATNITSAVSYVGKVSIGADGRGAVQSLIPQDISVEGRTKGALTLNGQPVFVYPLPNKEWVALSDAEKLNSTVDFYPGGSTGEKLPLPSSKISGLAKMVAQTPTPEAATPTQTPAPTATKEPTAQPTPDKPKQIILNVDGLTPEKLAKISIDSKGKLGDVYPYAKHTSVSVVPEMVFVDNSKFYCKCYFGENESMTIPVDYFQLLVNSQYRSVPPDQYGKIDLGYTTKLAGLNITPKEGEKPPKTLEEVYNLLAKNGAKQVLLVLVK